MFGKRQDVTKKDDDATSKKEVQLPLLAGQREAPALHPVPERTGKKMFCGLGCTPVQVPSGQMGMLENCGKFQATLNPGLVCTVCCFETVRMVDLRTRQISCHSDSKTKDSVTVNVATAVTYCIDPENVYAATYTIAEPESQIRSLIDDVIRSSLPLLTLDESGVVRGEGSYCALAQGRGRRGHGPLWFHHHQVGRVWEGRRPLSPMSDRDARMRTHAARPRVHSHCRHTAPRSVLITDLRPEASVLHAMNEINASRRLREAAVDKAEAEKILVIKAGEADAEAKHLSGVGIARMRAAITGGFKESITDMSDSCGLKPAEVVNMMLVTQYLDVLKGFAESGKSSVVVPHGMSFPTDMQAAVRDGMVQAHSISRV